MSTSRLIDETVILRYILDGNSHMRAGRRVKGLHNRLSCEIENSAGEGESMADGRLFQEFYRVVRLIPRGRVASYGQVALLAGHPRSARFVGFALHANPEPGVIPCHRVVFKDGRLTDGFAFGGPGVQRELLEGEGVAFRSDGRIDMDAFQWDCFDREELRVLEGLK